MRKDGMHSIPYLAELPGDLNRDGMVDISDMMLLSQDWIKQTSGYE